MVVLYLVTGIVALALLNRGDSFTTLALVLVTLASVALGWQLGTQLQLGLLVPWSLILFALPFGDVERPSPSGDGPFPLVVFAVWPMAVGSTLLVLASAGARHLSGRACAQLSE